MSKWSSTNKAEWWLKVATFVLAVLTFLCGVPNQLALMIPALRDPTVRTVLVVSGTLVFVFLAGLRLIRWRHQISAWEAALLIAGLCVVPALTVFFVRGGYGDGLYVAGEQCLTDPVASFHFRDSAEGWEDLIRWDAGYTAAEKIPNAARLPQTSAERGLGYELRLKSGDWINHVVEYKRPLSADLVVAHTYLPKTPDIVEAWASIQVVDSPSGRPLASAGSALDAGKWNQLALHLADKFDDEGTPLSERPVYVQVHWSVRARPNPDSLTVIARLDDVCWFNYPGTQIGQTEEQGEGRTLFTFENQYVGEWSGTNGTTTPAALRPSSEVAYRGKWSLALDADLEAGGTVESRAFFRHPLRPQAAVAVVAQVYVPRDVPPQCSFWANLFVDGAEWYGSPTVALRPGEWTTAVWDLRGVDLSGGAPRFGIQVGVEGGAYRGPVYIDDVQLFAR